MSDVKKPAMVTQPTKLKLASPTIVLPSAGNFEVDCSTCRERNFKLHVRPDRSAGSARIVEVICAKCKKPYPIDENGCFVRGGHTTIHARRKPAASG